MAIQKKPGNPFDVTKNYSISPTTITKKRIRNYINALEILSNKTIAYKQFGCRDKLTEQSIHAYLLEKFLLS